MDQSTCHQFRLCVLSAGIAAAVAVAWCGSWASAQTWEVATDYAKLKTRLGTALPTGSGVVISQVEAPGPPLGSPPMSPATAYYIDANHYEFAATPFDPTSTPMSLTDGSDNALSPGPSSPQFDEVHERISGHAQNVVGFWYYGNLSSMAPSANNLTLYEVNHWLSNVLNVNGSAPLAQPFRVQNHSWISDLNSIGEAQSALRRLDYLIETGETTMVVGANNDPTPASALAHPRVFAHSYNAIVVGVTSGAHSRGQTNGVYGSGRFKPDIVAPAGLTSTATAHVSSAAAMLHQSAAGTDAARSETMKAILMAGATKHGRRDANGNLVLDENEQPVEPEFTTFVDPTTESANPWNRTTARPLDDLFGAGELNAYNSHLIQLGGQQAGATLAAAPTAAAVESYGWDYQDFKSQPSAGARYYNFVVPEGSHADELSILLAWNVKVTDTPAPGFTPSESLQDLDLKLYDSTGGFLGIPTPIDQSISTVDNVEHIHYKKGDVHSLMSNLGAGIYTLEVTGAGGWDYGLAWRLATKFDQFSADFDENGLVDGADFLRWQRNSGTLLGAAHGDGDADGDGDVDEDDLAAFKSGAIATPPPMFASAAVSIPEPGAFASLATGVILLAMGRIRGRGRRGRRESV